MKRNIGTMDKGLRIFAGTISGMVGFTREPKSALNALLILAAAYLLITAFAGICGIYSAFGLNTREKE
jgi:Inner membrane protein YgaP-like, transmembrane domain